MTRVVVSDLRTAGYCVDGAELWFKAHDLNFRDFIKHGLDVEVVRPIGDPFSQRVIAIAEEREG
ncbi:hypothetical protein [Novosphingobium resinovorum]|uniref:Uncharacterized protein n=1 Tax=Novosphingobium resinovorum TaxID=158500 RepID=A0A1D8A337_9SPHN|nr:hypothetical protein [Novosphingobium resinovorum]AOR76563.1 hypothetical protein BES08_07235 [Novosphingobium resinovorum]